MIETTRRHLLYITNTNKVDGEERRCFGGVTVMMKACLWLFVGGDIFADGKIFESILLHPISSYNHIPVLYSDGKRGQEYYGKY